VKQNNIVSAINTEVIFSGGAIMPENKKGGPKGPYYTGHTHFSYNDSLLHRTYHFRAHETVQDMIRRAEEEMERNKYYN